MTLSHTSSLLNQANQQLRSGNYDKATELYRGALQERPTLARMIQFNLELAQKRLLKSATEGRSSLPQHDLSANWVSHEDLQNDSNSPRIVLGGMVLGYPQKGNNAMPPRIAECAHLYEQIAQIQDLHGLRLITGEELTRPPVPAHKPSAFVHAFGTQDIRLAPIWYANSRDLRAAVEKESPFNLPRVFRAYQYDAGVGCGLVLVGECILQGDAWQLTDLALANPYLPVLLTLAAPEGYLSDAALIPYPSLLRGGIHEHECYVGNHANDPTSLAQELLLEHLRALQHGWALGQLQVDIREAIGTEAILSIDFKEWLWSIFSLRIKPWNPPEISQSMAEYWQEVFDTPPFMRAAEKFSNQSAREREGNALLCPPRAIPSLRALTISRTLGTLEQTCGVSQFILVQEGPLIQRWRLRWPEIAPNQVRAIALDGAVRVPRVLVGKDNVSKDVSETPAGVSAILIGETVAANSMQLIMPIAPDFAWPSIKPMTPTCVVNVIVTAADLPMGIFSAFLESLSLQRGVTFGQIVVILPSSGDQKAFDARLKRNYAGRYLLLPAREGDLYKQRVQRATAAIKQQPDDAYMLFINQPLVLHDPRTLATLAQVLATPKTVTTSALLIGNVEIKSKPETVICAGGFFPVLCQSKTEIEWRNENLAVAMPRTTLPVASHGDALFMVKSKDWKKSGGFAGIEAEDENAVHEYFAKLAANNRLHLLVPHVTVEMHAVAANLNSSYAGWKPATNLTVSSNAVCIEVLPS
ncbi:hypothetical protein [Polaromonas eurypsychrophila]|uniref:Uncharacterized protein n=1 Tax=Polaromonas eurypsychrophila TaxID=1614635 RepID=A0A916SPS5_9BURK|nr:hypothetical protein [Polaromonas eurypsychrophila]GGB09619.1 hypothetical protein GCM10011496_33160 [Polaromonas eurypsychrophila]